MTRHRTTWRELSLVMTTTYLASVAQANVANALYEINEHATSAVAAGAAPARSKGHAAGGALPNAPCAPATCSRSGTQAPPGPS